MAKSIHYKFIGVALVLLLTGCSQALNLMIRTGMVERPEVTVLGAKMLGLGLDGLKMEFELEVYNPNSVAVALQGMAYQFSVNDKLIFSGVHEQNLSIGAKESSQFVLPMNVNVGHLIDTLSVMQLGSRPEYQLDAEIKMSLPVIGATKVPVKHTGELALPKILTSPLFRAPGQSGQVPRGI